MSESDGKAYLIEHEGVKPWAPFNMGFCKALTQFAPGIGHTVICGHVHTYMIWQVQMPTVKGQHVLVSEKRTNFDNWQNLDGYQLFDQGWHLGKEVSGRLKLAFDTLVNGGNVEAALAYESELASRREVGIPVLITSLIKDKQNGSRN